MIPQPLERGVSIPPHDDRQQMKVCELAVKWGISPTLAFKLYAMADVVPFGLSIRSGYRTALEQRELERRGRPTAPDELSTHRTCPAIGADLDVHVAVTPMVKAIFGEAAVTVGLRWGGGSMLDEYGLPSDWNHVDLGPRGNPSR